MALPSNRSSMVAGRTSPNSRNSEIVNPVRRSFSGNPFTKPSIVANPRSLNPITPANSPSDNPRRNSVSRENLFTSRDNEEKENGKDQSPKPVRVRSPTVGKSTKHFMSPTISAASKIAISPKKKILGDRNEPIRSSLSFSTIKSSSLNSVNPNPEASMALESDTNPIIAPISNPKSSKTVRFGGFEVIPGPHDDSESPYDFKPEVVPMAVETDTKPEISASISNSVIEAPPSKSSKTVKLVGFEVIPESYDASDSKYDTNSEIVPMAVEADTKPVIALISNSAIAEAPPKASKTVSFSDAEAISVSNNDLESLAKSNLTEEVDCVNLDPSFKISAVSSPTIAPLDADPLIPPYDPKTNYLSPRPQFLHYRPNRRINRYEPDGRLEELFSSAGVSNSGFFTGETDSEDPHMESDEASSNESQIEEKSEEEEEEEIINDSEQSSVETKKLYKSQFSRIFKMSSLFFILFTASFSFHIAVHDPDIFERARLLTMEDFHSSETSELAKTNFNVLVGKLEVWHANSKSYISDVVFKIRGGRPLIYLNQTEFLHKDVNADGQCLLLENSLNVLEAAMKERKIDIVEDTIEIEGQNCEVQEEKEKSLHEIEAVKEREIVIGEERIEREGQNEEGEEQEHVEESFQEIEAIMAKEIDIETVETKSQNEESFHQKIKAEANEEENGEASEELLQEIIEETSTNSASDQINEEDDIQEQQTEENYEVSSSPDFKIHDPIQQEAEIEEETNDSMQQSNTESQYQSSPPVSPPSESQSDVEEENRGKIDLIRTATDHGIPTDSAQKMAVIISVILLGLTLFIPAGLIYARKSGTKPSSMADLAEEKQVEQPLVKETNIQSPVVREEEEEKEEEVVDDDDREDVAGEFCSSETSSFQYSSMRGRETEEMKRSSEVQSRSQGRKMRKDSRRESMASSSLDEYSVSTSASPSYGSFTTYEKIPIKHGNGDEEIVTPVRRSSRIRKQHNNS